MKQSMTIKSLIRRSYKTAVDKGWHISDLSDLEITALIHSEVSEVAEEIRSGRNPQEIYYHSCDIYNEKPEGIPVELADILIRIFDYCGNKKIPLEKALRLKMDFNSTRPYRHGGKKY